MQIYLCVNIKQYTEYIRFKNDVLPNPQYVLLKKEVDHFVIIIDNLLIKVLLK